MLKFIVCKGKHVKISLFWLDFICFTTSFSHFVKNYLVSEYKIYTFAVT